tara:strand:+ start:4500 stop:5411 length:912 start_codon:yes stop_codon:yes gene_type:complete
MPLSCLGRVKRNTGESKRPPPLADVQLNHIRCDRSGSTTSMHEESTNGLYEYITTFANNAHKQNSKIHFKFGTFDDTTESCLDTTSIANIKDTVFKDWIRRKIEPRGMTRLVDTAYEDIDELLKKYKEEKIKANKIKLEMRVSAVYCLVTDGFDNKSNRSCEQLKKKIKEANEEGITCMYLGANQDAISTGHNFGFNMENCLNIDSSGDGTEQGFRSATLSAARAATYAGATPQVLRQQSGFTQMERESSSQSVNTSINMFHSISAPQPTTQNGFDFQNAMFGPPPLIPVNSILRTPATFLRS